MYVIKVQINRMMIKLFFWEIILFRDYLYILFLCLFSLHSCLILYTEIKHVQLDAFHWEARRLCPEFRPARIIARGQLIKIKILRALHSRVFWASRPREIATWNSNFNRSNLSRSSLSISLEDVSSKACKNLFNVYLFNQSRWEFFLIKN